MGISRKAKKPDRTYSPKKMWRPLAQVLNAHFSAVTETEDWVDLWEPKRLMWDKIMENLRQQKETYGTIRYFDSLRFVESLIVDDDVFFRLSASLLSAPAVEDFAEHGGFFDCVQDFFLKTYKLSPDIIQGSTENRVIIRLPGLRYRLMTGYPSKRRVIRDFKRLTDGISTFEFGFGIDGEYLIIAGFMEPGDESQPHNPEFVKVGRGLLEMARGGQALD